MNLVMNNIQKIALIIPLLSLSLTGCEKWLGIKPADRIVEENVFNNESGIQSSLNGVYNDLLKSDLYGQALGSEFIEILAQQYSIRPTNTNFTEVSNYSYTTVYTKGRLERTWNAAYKTILNCNKIIENTEKNKNQFSNQTLKLILGESIAIRSFLHFDMLRLFGPIYKTSKTLKSIPYVNQVSVSASPLLSAEDAINAIITDLDKAEQLLKEVDPIITDGPLNTVEPGQDNTLRFRSLRFNYYAVLALKARAYLYAGDNANALKYAKLIIDDPQRSNFFPFVNHTEILSNVANTDRVFSTEIIFGMYNTGRNTIFQNYFNPDAAQATNLLIPRAGNIATLFAGEESDYRNFPIWKSSNQEANAAYSMKFRSGDNTTLYRNNIMPLIRLGEMYLIAAETETDTQKAYSYLNKLRNQRGLLDISDNLLGRIRNEYIKEFFGEGQLFFYYKRNATTPLRNGISNNNITMNTTRYVPQLPESEIKYRD